MLTKLVSLGIDYLRMTSNEDSAKSSMLDAFMQAVAIDTEMGYQHVSGGMLGFYGKKTRHAFLGARKDWQMLNLTGKICREPAIDMLRLRGRPTRIDLQITLHVDGGVQQKLADCIQDSMKARPADGRKWKTKWIMEDGRIQTVYLGSRQSEWFGRIYDKFAESKELVYKDCIRFELEIKGEAAKDVWGRMLQGPGWLSFINTLVIQWFKAHGIDIPNEYQLEERFTQPPREKHADDKKLAWLSRMVSGTVAHLCGTGHFFPAFEALFRQALTEHERTGILLATALIDI